MNVIHKYTLEIKYEQSIPMPAFCKVLHAGEQRGKLCLWAMVDDQQPKHPMRVRIHVTGHPDDLSQYAGEEWRYVDSVVMHDGELVWHVFVLKR